MKRISSLENPLFKTLKKLATSARARQKEQKTLLDGIHLAQMLCASHFGCAPIEAIILSEEGALNAEILRLLEENSLQNQTFIFSNVLFKELSHLESPSGILLAINLGKISNENQRPNAQQNSVLLDGVQDTGNLGSILRSAAAAGFTQILLSDNCGKAWSPKTLRAGMGAHFSLQIFESVYLLDFMRNFSGKVLATAMKTENSIYALDLKKQPIAWVFGAEGQGICAEILDAVHIKCAIPMAKNSESLNVAAAAAICLFETARQNEFKTISE